MKDCSTEEIKSLTGTSTANQAATVSTHRRKSALGVSAILSCWILLYCVLARHAAGPRADLSLSKNENHRPTIIIHDHDEFCYMTGRLPLDRANDLHELAIRATQRRESHHNRASLNQTAAAFWHVPILETSSDPTKIPALVQIMFHLQAMDETGNAVTTGGDEFVVTLQGWSSLGWSYKTAMYTTDLHNGTYQASLILPRLRVDCVYATLMHYYTRDEGLGYFGIQGRSYKGVSFDLHHGPVSLELPHDFVHSLNTLETDMTLQTMLQMRPECLSTQIGVDQLMSGLWMEQGVVPYNELSLRATWEPFCCRPPSLKPKNATFVRIGSSTMPYPSVHVGNVYDLTRPFHDKWIDALLNRLPSLSANDTVVFSAGLHQLLYGYNVETAARLVRRMICQIAAVFSGKLIVVGPCPIQQQLFSKIDMTDLNVLLLNAILRKQIVDESHGRLGLYCDNTIVDLDVLVSYPDLATGSLLDPDSTRIALAKQRETIHETQEELNLTHKLQSAVDYGTNRTLFFAEIHDFLRPRPETYREGDKVHDLREFDNGGILFFGAHSEFIEHLLVVRALGGS